MVEVAMLITNIDKLKDDRSLVNSIDWNMTPEKAVGLYLEWGSGWVRNNEVVSNTDGESIYFVLYDWEKEPLATLIRRTVDGAEEIAKIEVPKALFMDSWYEDGIRPGGTVHPPNQALKEWINSKISGPPLDWSVN
jgi:hypothetical protein